MKHISLLVFSWFRFASKGVTKTVRILYILEQTLFLKVTPLTLWKQMCFLCNWKFLTYDLLCLDSSLYYRHFRCEGQHIVKPPYFKCMPFQVHYISFFQSFRRIFSLRISFAIHAPTCLRSFSFYLIFLILLTSPLL